MFYAKSDADFLIVQKAVETAENSNTVVVGDDTDLLVLLIYHTKLNHNEIFFIPEPKKNSKCRIWNVKQVKTELGSFVCKHILFPCHVTPLLDCLELEKQMLSYKRQLRSLIQPSQHQAKLNQLAKGC